MGRVHYLLAKAPYISHRFLYFNNMHSCIIHPSTILVLWSECVKYATSPNNYVNTIYSKWGLLKLSLN